MFLSTEIYINVTVGTLLIIVAFIILRGRQEVADGIYRYYHAFEDPTWRPRWMPMFYRPTMVQARFLACALGIAALAFGLSLIVTSLT